MTEGLRHAEPVMGTVVSFDVRDAGSGARRAAIGAGLDRAVRWLHRVDRVFSTYRPDSQISRLDRGELALADCDPDVAEVLALGEAAGEPEPGRPWGLAVAHPLHPGGFATLVRGRDIALATSGTAERGEHILDPRTGRPASGGLASVSVVGASLTAVDIAATSAFVLGPEARGWLERQPGLEGFAVLADGRAWWTSGFSAYALLPDATG